eukprot:TRINITY_DN25124_c0_g1_i3.p1 TRINITY_DN25124_c0_g1~~TRINITY_DN25124_c0_g1_i3.p1  ORF type:complete len:471 (+),score=141.59 TRINITY_DN25124_c0_g1_i3:120-1532(+)
MTERLVEESDSVAVLREQAKLRQMKGVSSLRKAELRKAIEEFDDERGFDGGDDTAAEAQRKRKRDTDDDDESSSVAAPPKKAKAKAKAKAAPKRKATNWATTVDPIEGAEYTEHLEQVGNSKFFVSCDGIYDSEKKERVAPLGKVLSTYCCAGDLVCTINKDAVEVYKINTTTGAKTKEQDIPLPDAFRRSREIYSRVWMSTDHSTVAVLLNKTFGFYNVEDDSWTRIVNCPQDSTFAYGRLLVHATTKEAFLFYTANVKVGRRQVPMMHAFRSAEDGAACDDLDDCDGSVMACFVDPRSNTPRLVTGGNVVQIHAVTLPDTPQGTPSVHIIKSINANHKNGCVQSIGVDASTGILCTGASFDKTLFLWDAYEENTVRGKCIGKVMKLGDAFAGRYVGACSKFHVQAIASVTTDPDKPVFVTGNSNNADDACVKLVKLKPTTREIARPLDPKTVRKQAKAKRRGKSSFFF